MSIPQIVATQLSDPGPDKPLLVLGASLGTTAETLWAPVVPLLADHARLLAWDLPGHGRSPSPTEGFTVAELADAVAGLVATHRADGQAAYSAGVSLGGATGLELGVGHPGAVDGIAVVCSGAKLGTPEAWRERAATVRAQGTPVMVSGSAQRWFAPGFLERHPDRGSAMLHDLSSIDDEGYAACCDALADYDVTDRLGEITDAVLALNGADDAVAPPELGEQLARSVGRGRAVVLPGVAHQAPVEDPEATAANLRELLDTARDTSSAGAPTPTGTHRHDGDPTRSQVYDAGMTVRREVLGDAHVDRANASIDPFTRDFQDLITQYAWGTIWTRPGLDRVTRSAITLTALIAGHHDDELAMHIRAALRNGMTREQIGEVLLQSAIYCSVPSANTAFKIAQRVFAELDATPDTEEGA